jgi:hypothetical protein
MSRRRHAHFVPNCETLPPFYDGMTNRPPPDIASVQNWDRVSSSSTQHSPFCSHHPKQQTVAKQASIAVTTICAWKMPDSDLGRDTGCHGWGLSLYSSILLAKHQASTLITCDFSLPNPFQLVVHWLLYCQCCVRDADSTIKYKLSSPFNLVILGGEGGHFI